MQVSVRPRKAKVENPFEVGVDKMSQDKVASAYRDPVEKGFQKGIPNSVFIVENHSSHKSPK
jgi:hypothetical protein